MSWSDMRQVFGYPLWMIGGIAVTAVFALRYRVTRCIGDKAAALLAACFGLMGLGGWLSLFTRVPGNRVPLAMWAALYTWMMIGVGVFLVALVLWMLGKAWRSRHLRQR